MHQIWSALEHGPQFLNFFKTAPAHCLTVPSTQTAPVFRACIAAQFGSGYCTGNFCQFWNLQKSKKLLCEKGCNFFRSFYTTIFFILTEIMPHKDQPSGSLTECTSQNSSKKISMIMQRKGQHCICLTMRAKKQPWNEIERFTQSQALPFRRLISQTYINIYNNLIIILFWHWFCQLDTSRWYK